MQDRKLLLRVILKLFISLSVLWVIYIFMAGLFMPLNNSKNALQKFNLSLLNDNSAAYFQTTSRQILVIKLSGDYSVFWANDPIYGCKLEFIDDFIKPVCIDIHYGLDGFSADGRQSLLQPEYEITEKDMLIVF